ncbi:hypothetical protein BO79DRAFT_240798 [Aspergillus costaricaensis CBS 115574]|uniref:Uncharacterized protein n=1 Tax=Aspergillus costaricaensis CBS 115574 TaxID=1448317 RepID=A0ACD1I0V4_9EURO|nr:hypothetical protein BO79DRAFT_240798 [Aspergillus costaricaensis CBS 115574]RAK83922.1 hypothetical protein BO79DRAFT_240798 [Aspergillus costaricaensis CBS 115574]
MESSMDPSATKANDRAEQGQPDKEAPLRSEDCQLGQNDVLHPAVTAISFKARCQLMGVYIPRILQLACSGPARTHATHLPEMLLVQYVREVIVRARTHGARVMTIAVIYRDVHDIGCRRLS